MNRHLILKWSNLQNVGCEHHSFDGTFVDSGYSAVSFTKFNLHKFWMYKGKERSFPTILET